jgi:hypothetical protein
MNPSPVGATAFMCMPLPSSSLALSTRRQVDPWSTDRQTAARRSHWDTPASPTATADRPSAATEYID